MIEVKRTVFSLDTRYISAALRPEKEPLWEDGQELDDLTPSGLLLVW